MPGMAYPVKGVCAVTRRNFLRSVIAAGVCAALPKRRGLARHSPHVGHVLHMFRIRGTEATSFVTFERGLARGVIHTPDGSILVEDRGEGISRFVVIPPAFVCCVHPKTETQAAKPGKRRSVRHPPPPNPLAIEVRIMVAVSAESFAAAGGADQVRVEAQALVDQASVMARDSGYPDTTFVLTGTPLVSLTPTGDPWADLRSLSRDPMIAAERKVEQADIVAFMTESDNGVAASPRSLAGFGCDNGYFVFPRKYALVSYVFAHELGHNLGMQHNVEDAGQTQIPYSFGFHNDELERNCVMSVFRNWRRVPLWSTTAAMWQGKPMGKTGEADAARLLKEGAKLVSQYRYQLP